MNHTNLVVRFSVLESESIPNCTNSITNGDTGQDVPEEIPDLFFYNQYISGEVLLLLAWYCIYVVHPIIGALGVVGNLISFIVLRKCGLEQSSNILLFCLTIADMMCLLDAFNVKILNLNIIHFESWGILKYLEALFLAIAESMVAVACQIGFRASTYITVCIAVERLIAVFYPLHFSTLITPRRMWLAGLSTFLLWAPWIIFINAIEINFQYSNVNNRTQMISTVPIYEEDFIYAVVIWKLFPNLTHTIPFILVTVSCILISLKMATALRKRRRMASISTVQKSSVRTTRTLLLVCLVFSITHAAYIVTTIKPPNDSTRWINVFWIFLAVRQAFAYANSSFNFVIYIVFNKKFRTVFTGVFLPKFRFTETEHAQKSKVSIKNFEN